MELVTPEIHRILIRECFGKKSLPKSRRKSANIKVKEMENDGFVVVRNVWFLLPEK